MKLDHLLDEAVVVIFVPVEAELADPLKVICVGAAHFAQFLNHIPGMNLNGDQSHNLHGRYISATESPC